MLLAENGKIVKPCDKISCCLFHWVVMRVFKEDGRTQAKWYVRCLELSHLTCSFIMANSLPRAVHWSIMITGIFSVESVTMSSIETKK